MVDESKDEKGVTIEVLHFERHGSNDLWRDGKGQREAWEKDLWGGNWKWLVGDRSNKNFRVNKSQVRITW